MITIENKGKMIMPVIIKITQQNGKSETVKLPVEVWQRSGTKVFNYASTSSLTKIILDPDLVLPDMERKNNEWSN